jgi:hypothetical protein
MFLNLVISFLEMLMKSQLIANFFFGCRPMIAFAMAMTMLTECIPKRASTGIVVNNFVRSVFSCVDGIVAHPIICAIGNRWMYTIVGLIERLCQDMVHEEIRTQMARRSR